MWCDVMFCFNFIPAGFFLASLSTINWRCLGFLPVNHQEYFAYVGECLFYTRWKLSVFKIGHKKSKFQLSIIISLFESHKNIQYHTQKQRKIKFKARIWIQYWFKTTRHIDGQVGRTIQFIFACVLWKVSLQHAKCPPGSYNVFFNNCLSASGKLYQMFAILAGPFFNGILVRVGTTESPWDAAVIEVNWK